METITIQGRSFQVPVPYAAGHVLKENEASALNQTYHENIRNNFAKQVKDGLEAGVGDDVLQQKLNDYIQSYSFGTRTGGGGRTGDPVQAEAMTIARERVKAAIKTKGKKLSDYSAEQITTAARKLLDSQGDNGPIVTMARERVEQARAAANEAAADLDEIVDAMPTQEAEEPAQADEQPAAA